MIKEQFLIDSNVFINAKYFHYNFKYCKIFWDYLLKLHDNNVVFTINSVKRELLAKPDEIASWIETEVPPSFFQDEMMSMGSYAKLMNWAQTQDVSEKAKEDFASNSKADAFLIAHAMANNFTIITHEKSQAGAKKRIMIPNAAEAHGVKTLTLYEFLSTHSGQNFTCLP